MHGQNHIKKGNLRLKRHFLAAVSYAIS